MFYKPPPPPLKLRRPLLAKEGILGGMIAPEKRGKCSTRNLPLARGEWPKAESVFDKNQNDSKLYQ